VHYFFLNSASNSRATYEFLTFHAEYPMLHSVHSQFLTKMQSPAVTLSGHLWERALADTVNDNVRYEVSKTETDHNPEQIQKKTELIQLLRSWREGDEQEQHDTWEYLKRALDEDRLSDRKLFP
jgi:hypothetical protein